MQQHARSHACFSWRFPAAAPLAWPSCATRRLLVPRLGHAAPPACCTCASYAFACCACACHAFLLLMWLLPTPPTCPFTARAWTCGAGCLLPPWRPATQMAPLLAGCTATWPPAPTRRPWMRLRCRWAKWRWSCAARCPGVGVDDWGCVSVSRCVKVCWWMIGAALARLHNVRSEGRSPLTCVVTGEP